MKKLILTLSAAVIAGMVQAATVVWSSGTMFKPTSGTDGSFTENKATTKASSYLYELTPEKYAEFLAMDYATGSAAIFEAYKDATPNAVGDNGSGKNQFKSGVGTISTTADANDKLYAAIIYRYVDTANNMDMYIANLAYGEVGDKGYDVNIEDIGQKWAGEGKATIGAWTNAAADVPEPTSGLLLLLGMAGLALRRRRA